MRRFCDISKRKTHETLLNSCSVVPLQIEIIIPFWQMNQYLKIDCYDARVA